MADLQKPGEQFAQDNPTTCIFFDGRKDRTKQITYREDTGKDYKREVVEEHCSMTNEPVGLYLD